MLTVKQCEAIRRNWDAANCMDSDSVAEMGERHVPQLLDTARELRELLVLARAWMKKRPRESTLQNRGTWAKFGEACQRIDKALE